jgi:hypothetical protein
MFVRNVFAVTLLAGLAAGQTTYTAVSGNNTSASSNFTGNHDNRTGVLNVEFEPVPGNVSHLDTHDLVFPGWGGKIFVNFLNWFSTSDSCSSGPAGIGGWGPVRLTCASHILTQYNSNDAVQVHAQMNDILARHFDGAMLNYESDQAGGIVDGANHKTRADLEARCTGGNCPLQFAIMADGSGVKFNPGFSGALKCPQPGSSAAANEDCIIAHLKDDFCYMNQQFFVSPAYLKVGGHPIWQSFIGESGWTLNPTGAAPSWQDLWIHVQDFVQNLPGNCPALSPQYANSPNNGIPWLIFENTGGFNQDGQSSNSQGAFAWIHPGNGVSGQTGSVTQDQSNLKGFYQAAQANPSKNAWGASFSGFNDILAGWSPAPPPGGDITQGGRVEDNGCGRTWLNTFAAATAFSPSFLQAVTWSDYDEGTEIETGIDNCVNSVTASVSGNTLSWNVNFATRLDGSAGDDSTIDRFNIWDSSDGQNLTLATSVCNLGGATVSGDHLCTSTGTPTRSINVKTLLGSVRLHQVYVQAVGKPSILNHITTSAVNYQPVDVTVTSQTSGTVTSPFTITATASSSATVTGWHIYANGVDKFGAGQTNSISAPMSLAAGTYTIIVRAWNSTGAFGDQTYTLTVQ